MHPRTSRRAALALALLVAIGVLGPWIDAREFGMPRAYYGYDGVLAGGWAAGAALVAVGILFFVPEEKGRVRARLAAAAYAMAAIPAMLVLVGLRLIPVDDIGGVFDSSWRPGWGLFVALAAALGGAVLAWRSHEAPFVVVRAEDEAPASAATVMVALPRQRR